MQIKKDEKTYEVPPIKQTKTKLGFKQKRLINIIFIIGFFALSLQIKEMSAWQASIWLGMAALLFNIMKWPFYFYERHED